MDVLTGKWEKAWGAIQEIVHGVWDAIAGEVKLAVDKVMFVINLFMDTFGGAIKTGVDAVVNFFTALPGRILGALTGAAKWLVQRGKDIITGLADGIIDTWTTTLTWFGKLGSLIVTGVGDAAKWLYSAGGDIVTGLINGISDSWSKVWSFLKSKLGDLMHNVMHFFGIGSPSKVFAGIGTNLMEGLAGGGLHAGISQCSIKGCLCGCQLLLDDGDDLRGLTGSDVELHLTAGGLYGPFGRANRVP